MVVPSVRAWRFRDKGIDIGTGAVSGRAHEDASVPGYLDRNGLPAAVYDFVFKWMIHDSTSQICLVVTIPPVATYSQNERLH